MKVSLDKQLFKVTSMEMVSLRLPHSYASPQPFIMWDDAQPPPLFHVAVVWSILTNPSKEASCHVWGYNLLIRLWSLWPRFQNSEEHSLRWVPSLLPHYLLELKLWPLTTSTQNANLGQCFSACSVFLRDKYTELFPLLCLCVTDECCWQRKKSLKSENKKHFSVKLFLYLPHNWCRRSITKWNGSLSIVIGHSRPG